jgi:dihydropteroate synthase
MMETPREPHSVISMETWRSPHGRQLPPIGGRTLIMAVLNVTPDSFSDGGQLPSAQAVVDRAGELLADGADILDLGGESTRPSATAVSAAEELDRVLPAIVAVRKALPDCALSIDTYKSAVAEAAISAGSDIINDVWGLTYGIAEEDWAAWKNAVRSGSFDAVACPTSPMAEAGARLNAPVIVMHNRRDRNYQDFWADVLLDLQASLGVARAAGIPQHQLWVDPGFGFAKNVRQNLEVLRDLRRVVALGLPVLVGTSRKSTIGAVLGVEVADRLEGGGATLSWAIQQGCHMVRVHDVREMTRVVRMTDAIKAGLAFSIEATHG